METGEEGFGTLGCLVVLLLTPPESCRRGCDPGAVAEGSTVAL